MMRPAHPPVLYVEWGDAGQLSGGWQDREEMITDARRFYGSIVAVGFLLEETPDYLVLASGYNAGNDDAAHGFWVPKSEIRKRVQLRAARGMA